MCSDCATKESKRLNALGKDKQAAWRISHKTYMREYNKSYHEEHREENNKRSKNYQKEHPEIARNIARHRRDNAIIARERYTKECEVITTEAFGGKCFNCGGKNRLCIDHNYPLSRGYALTILNAVVLCKICNSKKHAKLPEEFYSIEKLNELSMVFCGIAKKYPDIAKNPPVKPEKSDGPITHKLCPKCGEGKDIDKFKAIKTATGMSRHSYCMECAREYERLRSKNRRDAKKQEIANCSNKRQV
jgi:5-methylcytosine-specific restriction endonuclease McrA